MREDQHHLGVAQREVRQPVGDRGHPASRMDQDRNRRFARQREDPVHLRPVERERLGAWVQLDPARALLDAALPLLHGRFGGVEPAEGNQPPVAFPRPTRARGRWAPGRRACARGRAVGTHTPSSRPRHRAVRAASRGPASGRPRPSRGGCARRTLPPRPASTAPPSVEERCDRVSVEGGAHGQPILPHRVRPLRPARCRAASGRPFPTACDTFVTLVSTASQD